MEGKAMYFYDPVSCDKIDINYVDKKVYITGFIDSIKKCSDIITLNIRDKNGAIQTVINPKMISRELYENALSLEEKKFITVCGIIEYRDLNRINTKMKTGRLELIADDFFLTEPEDLHDFDPAGCGLMYAEEFCSNVAVSKYL
jgi:aspartyl-tRNA synthetase